MKRTLTVLGLAALAFGLVACSTPIETGAGAQESTSSSPSESTKTSEAPSATPSKDSSTKGSSAMGTSTYLASIDAGKASVPALSGIPEDELLAAGEAACTEMANNTPIMEALDPILAAVPSLSDASQQDQVKVAGFFIGVSAVTLCPENSDYLKQLTGN